MSRILAAVASVTITTAASGETITIETIGWAGSGETNGWQYVSLDSPFSDGAARFAADSRIESPRWAGADILNVEVRLRCSTNAPDRFLQICFLRDGDIVSGPIRFDAVFAADRPESQTLPVGRTLHANSIALSLSDGSVGDWGVYEVRLETADTTYVPPIEDDPKRKTGFAVIIQ